MTRILPLVLLLAGCHLFRPPEPVVEYRTVTVPAEVPEACAAPLVLRARPRAVCPGEPDKSEACRDPRGIMLTWDQVDVLKAMLIDVYAWGDACQAAVKAQAEQ